MTTRVGGAGKSCATRGGREEGWSSTPPARDSPRRRERRSTELADPDWSATEKTCFQYGAALGAAQLGAVMFSGLIFAVAFHEVLKTWSPGPRNLGHRRNEEHPFSLTKCPKLPAFGLLALGSALAVVALLFRPY